MDPGSEKLSMRNRSGKTVPPEFWQYKIVDERLERKNSSAEILAV